jgi:hypothetical protein
MAARVPNTITDKAWADLGRRAQKAHPDVLSDDATRRRLASTAQRRKAGLS